MDNKFRIFCPEQATCEDACENCNKTKDELGHEINKRYLKSIGKTCMCAECSDQ